MNLVRTLAMALGVMVSLTAIAQHHSETPAAVAARVALRGFSDGIMIPEMRVVRRNDTLTVQADLINTLDVDRTMYYRFRWLDSNGSQVGDGESWKQIGVMGRAQQTIKSVAPTSVAIDFRLEMNVESR